MIAIFKDKNDVNEKNLIGFLAFCVMVIFAVTDLITGYFGKDLVINEDIYHSFLVLCLGAFFSGNVDKYILKNSKENNNNQLNKEENGPANY